LALGDRMVYELGLEESTNTTARWMAHHLADLIVRARTLKGVKQEQAAAAATDLVLKLWSKREVVPGNVYPLKDLGNALSVLRLLESEASPFSRVSKRETDVLLANTFDGLRKLVAHGIFLTFSKLDERLEDDAKIPFLIDEEKRVIDAANLWLEHFQKARKTSTPRVVIARDLSEAANSTEPEALTEEEIVKRTFISEIDELQVTLSKLKKQIEIDG
jgi:hypothetical protein